MKRHNEILARIALEKAENALQDACNSIDISLFVVQNRAYYSVFYIVSALAYLDDFVTKSHHKLMGQFNKRYIYQNTIFDKSLIKIYRSLIVNRELTDYDFTSKPVKENVIKDVENAKLFIDTVKPYILKMLDNQ